MELDYILQTQGLKKEYAGGFAALSGLTMHVPRGSIYGFVGKNGAGKTTLIRLVCGLQEPTSGSYRLCGVENGDAKIVRARRRMGAVVETPSIYLDMTARENLRQQYRVLGMPSEEGIDALMRAQREALGEAARWIAPKTPRLLFATNNAHKAREVKEILDGRYEVLSLREAGIELDVEETGKTFAENALLKAEAVTKLTGCAALADDTGLCVDALDGAPGVYSARYAGEHGNDAANVALLEENLKNVPAPRAARFVCAMALTRPGREPLVVEGRAEGEIIPECRGENGFGYDPVFLYAGGEKTFAEMSESEKNAVSHRKRAAAALIAALEAEK